MFKFLSFYLFSLLIKNILSIDTFTIYIFIINKLLISAALINTLSSSKINI